MTEEQQFEKKVQQQMTHNADPNARHARPVKPASVFDDAKPGDVFVSSGGEVARFDERGLWVVLIKDCALIGDPGDTPDTIGVPNSIWQKLAPAIDLGEGVTVERVGNTVLLNFTNPVQAVAVERGNRDIQWPFTGPPHGPIIGLSYTLAPPAPQLPPLPTWLGVVRGNITGIVSFVTTIEGGEMLNMTFPDGTCGEFAASDFTLCDAATHQHYGITCSDELRKAMGGAE